MSPIDLAMDMLQKRTPRSHIGGAEDRGAYQNLLESLEADDAHRGADNFAGDLTQDDWQNELDADAAEWNESVDGPHADDYSDYGFDEMSPSNIPIDDPMAHHELGMGHEAALAEGVSSPKPSNQSSWANKLSQMIQRDYESKLPPSDSPPTNPFKSGPSL
jgi:hypothetical protein